MSKSGKDQAMIRYYRAQRRVTVKHPPKDILPAYEAERLVTSLGLEKAIGLTKAQLEGYKYDDLLDAYKYGNLWYSHKFVAFSEELLKILEAKARAGVR